MTVSDSGDLVFYPKKTLKPIKLTKPFFSIHLPLISLKENYIVATSKEGHLCYWDIGSENSKSKPWVVVDDKLNSEGKAHQESISCFFLEDGCLITCSKGELKNWIINGKGTSSFCPNNVLDKLPSFSRDSISGTKNCLLVGSNEGDLALVSHGVMTHKKHDNFTFSHFVHCGDNFCISLRKTDFLYIQYNPLNVMPIPLLPESEKSELTFHPSWKTFYVVSKGYLLGYSLEKPDLQTLKIDLKKQSSYWSLLSHGEHLFCGGDDGSIFVISIKTRAICKTWKNGDSLNHFAKIGDEIVIFNKNSVAFGSPKSLLKSL